MDTELLRSPLATVQLVPIFSYLNLLGDFLFAKNYLKEDNQNQQISIVNALYEYLEDYHDHLPETEELIRNLLQGSDLYGEQENENLEPIFVNTMLDYIISSLVFDKYGNIYGFLADIIRKSDNFQFDHIMKVIKVTLQNATFENEYGASSTLTPLAVDRIYNDVILPLFPQPKSDLNILSLDYMFAQAGSTYLRLGRLNDTYYPDVKHRSLAKFDENLFDEYLTIGHIIANLLDSKKIDLLTMRVFALPALCFYVSTQKKVQREAITNNVFQPRHWERAYKTFLQYDFDALEQITYQLLHDNAYKMHLAFIHFQSRVASAKSVIDLHCNFLSDTEKEKLIPDYLKNAADYFQCKHGNALPDINVPFMNQIDYVAETYGNYELEVLQQLFNKFSLSEVRDVEIKMLKCDPGLNGQCKNQQHVFYDLLVFYFTTNRTSQYYALFHENYNVTLIKEEDDPQLFHQKLGLSESLDELIQSANRIVILKLVNEGIEEFLKELIQYKKERLKSYLTNSDIGLETNEWWKEFGLSLVPFYPCLLNNAETTICKMNNMQFLNQFQEDVSSLITNTDTRSMLSSFGINIKTIFAKQLIDEAVEAFVLSDNETSLFLHDEKADKTLFDTFSLHIEEPECETTSITVNSIKLVKTIVDKLKEKMAYQFTYINHMLNKMEILNASFLKSINIIKNHKLFVKTFYGDTGYGYKFIFTNNTGNKAEIALFRTGYDYKDKMFVSRYHNALKNEKIYFKMNVETLEYESDYPIFEINNQLRRKNTQVLFSDIAIHRDNNEQCDKIANLEKNEHSKFCPRYFNLNTKKRYEKYAEQLLKDHSILAQKKFSEEQIHNILKKYTFPDDQTFILYFVKRLLIDSNFEKSDWSDSCIIDNSELLNKLRYEIRLENNNVSIADGERRINSIYTYRERRKIEEETTIKNIINDYNEQEASYSATFEDYYAVRNFATTGDTRITGDTNEAKLMKLALYKLAIRQSDDPEHEFDLKLFRVECKPKKLVNNLLSVGNCMTLNKFTSTSSNMESASRLPVLPGEESTNVLYVMVFSGPYFRAKIETRTERPTKDKKIILLPGSTFIIKEVSTVYALGMNNVLKVKLAFEPRGIEKHKWYKNIMTEITKIEV